MIHLFLVEQHEHRQHVKELYIEEARQIGYRKLRLDVGPYAKSAERIYRSAGFVDIGPYAESEVPSEFHAQWQFFELSLA